MAPQPIQQFPRTYPTFGELRTDALPQQAGVPETIPWWFYDTQTYVDNATTRLTFFQAAVADESLNNLGAGGQFNDPDTFKLYNLMLDVFSATANQYVTTAAGGVAGAIDDIGNLVLTSRPRISLILSGKQYGPWPLSILHATGGAVGFGWGTFTAEESLQYANNGPFDGGAPLDGSIIILPKVGWRWVVEWPAVANISGDYRMRLVMFGMLSRQVR